MTAAERTSWYCCAECDKPATRDDPIANYVITDSSTGEQFKRTHLDFHAACIPAANKALRDGFKWATREAV